MHECINAGSEKIYKLVTGTMSSKKTDDWMQEHTAKKGDSAIQDLLDLVGNAEW